MLAFHKLFDRYLVRPSVSIHLHLVLSDGHAAHSVLQFQCCGVRAPSAYNFSRWRVCSSFSVAVSGRRPPTTPPGGGCAPVSVLRCPGAVCLQLLPVAGVLQFQCCGVWAPSSYNSSRWRVCSSFSVAVSGRRLTTTSPGGGCAPVSVLRCPGAV